MRLVVLLLLLVVRTLNAQSDSLKYLPLVEMTNSGIRIIEYFQEDFSFIVIDKTDNTVLTTSIDTGQVPRDTIWVASRSRFEPTEDFQMSHVCCYKGEDKHGYEYQYYSVHELDGITVTGWSYRVKWTGHWKHGRKNGKWYYYSPDGELIGTEKWKNGVLLSDPVSH